jgi:hypothetical protein
MQKDVLKLNSLGVYLVINHYHKWPKSTKTGKEEFQNEYEATWPEFIVFSVFGIRGICVSSKRFIMRNVFPNNTT